MLLVGSNGKLDWLASLKDLRPCLGRLLQTRRVPFHSLIIQPAIRLFAAAEEAKLGPKSDATSVVIVPKQQSAWEQRREQIYDRLRQNPVFQRIAGLGNFAKPVLQKGQEIVEDVQEKWETSPSPTVERIRVSNLLKFARNEFKGNGLW